MYGDDDGRESSLSELFLADADSHTPATEGYRAILGPTLLNQERVSSEGTGIDLSVREAVSVIGHHLFGRVSG